MGDFLAIVKEKNFIEVVSRSINQVIKLPVQNYHNLIDHIVLTGNHNHGGRPKSRKFESCECDRQLGECREHGLAKSPS